MVLFIVCICSFSFSNIAKENIFIDEAEFQLFSSQPQIVGDQLQTTPTTHKRDRESDPKKEGKQ